MRWFVLMGLVFCAAAAGERSPAFFDAYGYAGFGDGSARCRFQPVDIQGSGDVLDLVPSQESGDALDEGVAMLALASAFEFYGNATDMVAVSSNGYVALGTGLLAEDGGDFSNDCALPAVPENPSPVSARILALHDDLVGGGTLYAEYFATCPRTSGTEVDGACTVVQWQDWHHVKDLGPLSFQIILYHPSAAIAVQYLELPQQVFSSATVGIQNGSASSALTASCNESMQTQHSQAFCFYDPRFPSLIEQDTLFADDFQQP